MSLDEQLLNRNKSNEDQKVGEFNQARRQSLDTNSPDSSFDFNSLRHRTQLNKLKKEKKAGVSAKLASPVKKGTNSLLRQSWINLIDSFGLTLIWINIHVFLSHVLGNKLFCKLGGEWADKGLSVAGSGKSGKASSMLKTVEPMGLGCLDLGCLLIVIAVLVLIALMLNVITNPLQSLASLVGSAIWNALGLK